MSEKEFTIIIVGEGAVGKSCMLLRYTDNKFYDVFMTTIGVDFKTKYVNIDKTSIKLRIWDTPGAEKFRTINKAYYRYAHGVIVIYDISRRDTFNQASMWMDSVKKYSRPIPFILVGNKCDLERAVQREEGEELAAKYNVRYFETSNKENTNVEEPFSFIVSEMYRLHCSEKSTEPKESANESAPSRQKESKWFKFFAKSPEDTQTKNKAKEGSQRQLASKDKEEEELKRQFSSKDKEISQLKDFVMSKNKEVEMLANQISKKDNEIAELKNKFSKKCNEFSELNDQVLRRNSENIELRIQITNKNKRIEELENQALSKEKEIEELKNQFSHKDKRIEELENQALSKEKEIEELKNQFSHKDKRIEELENQVLCKEKEIKKLEKKCKREALKLSKERSNLLKTSPKKFIRVIDSEEIRSFERLEEIGSCNNSKVFKVAKKAIYELKVLNNDATITEFQNFLSEWEIMSMLDHPNVLKAFGIFLSDREHPPSILTEYIPTSISDAIVNKRLTRVDFIFAIYQIVEGMKYIHFQKVIHRDLKPSNILIDSDGTVKICNFCFSMLMNSEEQSTCCDARTQKCKTQEIICECDNCNEKADVYSFGVLLFFMISGGDMPKGTKAEMQPHFTEFSHKLISSCLNSELSNRPSFERIIDEMEINNYSLIEMTESELNEVKNKVKMYKQLIPKYDK